MKKGWTYKKLGEVCDILDYMRKPITKGKRESGDIPYYGATGCLDYVKDYIFDEKLVLLGEDGAKWGAGETSSYIIEGKSWVNNHAHALRPRREILLDEILVYYLNYSNLLPFITGVTVPKLNQEKMRSIDIPIAPIKEQKRVVERLDSAFAQIDELKANAEKQLTEARALFQKSLAKAMEPKEGWEEKTLGDLGDFKNGMNFAHNEKGVDLHLLGVGDFGNRFSIGNIGELQMISLNQQPSDEYLLKDGDIVFVRSNGNKQLVGRSLVVYPNDIPTTFSGFCIRFRKSSDNVDEKFLVYFLKSEETRKKLFGNGANISNLNQKILQSLVIPLPPLSEQQRIVERLDSISENVRKYEEIQQKIIAECDALKQALLRQVFE